MLKAVRSRGVRGNSSYRRLLQQPGRGGRRPRGMPRFACHRSLVQASQKVEKSSRTPQVERQRGRQLKQERAPFRAETRGFVEKPHQGVACPHEQPVMRDELWHLDGEAEPWRDGRRPAFVGRIRVRPMERRIDLGGIQRGRIPFEVRTRERKPIPLCARNAPTRRADAKAH